MTQGPPKNDSQSYMEDEQIIDLFWQRDEQAIRKTDLKYGKLLYRVAYNILHDNEDCEECKNDTLLDAWNAIPPERPRVLPAWLCRIMRNLAINRYREKHRDRRIPAELTVSLEELSLHLTDDAATPPTDLAASELGGHLSDYVRTLSDRRKYIFVGRFYLGYTLEYLAERLGVSAPTVHRDVRDIRKTLRTYLLERGIIL